MNNLKALRSLCNAIANTFYPDNSTMELMLFNENIDPQAEATPKDQAILRIAIALVMGYVETSRTENGVSTSIDYDALKVSIKYYCGLYGLDADEVLSEYERKIEDGSHYW